MFQKQEYSKCLARSKVFHPHERHKLVHEGAPSVRLFLIGKLQDLTGSCSQLIEIFIFLKCCTGLAVAKTKIKEIFGTK